MSDGALYGGIAGAILAGLVGLTVWGAIASSDAARECEAAGGHIESKFSHYQPQVIWTGKVAITVQQPIYVTECVK